MIIQVATDHSCLENRSGTKYKICTSYRSIEYYTVGITKPQAWVSSIDPGGHFQVSQVGQSLVFNTVRKCEKFACDKKRVCVCGTNKKVSYHYSNSQRKAAYILCI